MQQNTWRLLRSANPRDREKSECILAQQELLNCVQTKREFYRNNCAESKGNFDKVIDLDEQHNTCSTITLFIFTLPSKFTFLVTPCSQDRYTLKHHANDCGNFSVMCKAVPVQVNYLIDKASGVGKGGILQ